MTEQSSFNTPILFLIFNRPDTTQEVFNAIKKQRPKYLYVAADGARETKEGEKEICLKTRNIINQIDWDCELKTLFRDKNLGCGKAISSAITWFFENVEEGIILEDDCLPHLDFFYYCEELLEKYRNEPTIKIIGGANFQDGIKRGDASYYFSAYSHIWGWATWKRTWNEYSFTLEEYSKSDFKKTLKTYFPKWTERQVWMDKFLLMKKQAIDTWDYQLSFSIWENNGICIVPNVNLISNIGFGEDATHTTGNHQISCLPFEKILPLTHPKQLCINREADEFYYKKYNYKSPLKIFYRTIRRLFV